MYSPFEELEYVSDHLPAEGEVVLLSREGGALVCRPWNRCNLRQGVADPDLYGCLVQAGERLRAAAALPIWIGCLGFLWLLAAFHGLADLGATHWYIGPLLAPLIIGLTFWWIQQRQRGVFFNDVLPPIRGELQRRQIAPAALIAGVQQHPELRPLLNELVRWSPAPPAPVEMRYFEDRLY